MPTAAKLDDEFKRLAALAALNILETERTADFDIFPVLASQLFSTPIAAISLVDRDRQWFKASVGLDVTETSRDVSFCAHAILNPNEVLYVPDATQDPRFADNPLVVGDFGLRFYAGVPIIGPSGDALDDFGAGHASIAYLRDYAFSGLKIDRSFTASLETDPRSRIFIRDIIEMANALGIEVIAEGVETPGQLRLLQSRKVAAVQGYLLGHPMTPDAARDLVMRSRPPRPGTRGAARANDRKVLNVMSGLGVRGVTERKCM